MPATTAHTPALRPLDAAHARWARGFWGDVHTRTRDVTIPTMWESLQDPSVSPGLRNFRLAAGLESGVHVGPPFMDGDFYKWLEAAIASLETDPDPELAARVEELARLIASVQREDGYLHTPTFIAERNDEDVVALADRFNFETYNLGHLITAGVRHHRVTGSTTLLDAARKAASFLEDLATNKPVELARSAICPSHYMAVIDLLPRDGRRAVSPSRRGFRTRARRLRRGRRRQPGSHPGAGADRRRRARGARELPLCRSRRPRGRDRR